MTALTEYLDQYRQPVVYMTQPLLVSGTNIKSVSGVSLVGAGDLQLTTAHIQSLDAALAGKQATLVSGTNIKTVGGTTLLGAGNISIPNDAATWGNVSGTLSSQTDLQAALNAKQATIVSGTHVKTVSGQSIVGAGDLALQTSYITGLDAALAGKQATLVSGTNIKSISGVSLLAPGDLALQTSHIAGLDAALAGKQATLVSGGNVKTVGGATILGTGNIAVDVATWGNVSGTLSSQSDLTTALNAKQDSLVSGTTIKTVNGTSVLGSGNISTPNDAAVWGNLSGTLANQTDLNSALAGKQATLVSGTNIKTVNGYSVLGTGDLVISTDSAVWGSVSGSLANQTDLNSALAGKQATLVSGTNLKSVSGQSLLGAGNLQLTTAHIASLDAALAAKQDTLVSGTTIKTVNGTSLVGAGDVTISGAAWGNVTGTLSSQTDLSNALAGKQATLVSGTNLKTVSGVDLLAAGDLALQTSHIAGLDAALAGKQATLVSGGNVKTVGGTTILGTGNIAVDVATWGNVSGTLSSQTDLQTALNGKQATLVSGTNIKSISGVDIVSSGNLQLTTAHIQNLDSSLASKQDSLVSGTNIKSVSGVTLLGSGDLALQTSHIAGLDAAIAGKQATLVSGTNLKTVNGVSLLGSGGITLNEMSPIATDSLYANISGATTLPIPKTFTELNLVRTTAGKLPAVDGSQLTQVAYLADDVYNAKNYGASGEGTTFTTGTISNGSNSLSVVSTSTFRVGQGIAIYGAGSIGVTSKIHATVITAINGTTITLRDNATASVIGGRVEHSDHEAIQNCINAALYPGNSVTAPVKGHVYIPTGVYITHKPIHLGYGEAFKSVHLYGDGLKYSGTWPFMGTAIWAKNGGEPALTVNGSRMGVVYGISIIGVCRQYIEDNALGTQNPTEADANPSDWVDPDVLVDFPNCNTRYAPCCAVAIDAYIGPKRVSDHYPDQVIPNYVTGYATQYDKNFASSQITFELCSFEGFPVGAVIQPNSGDPGSGYWDGNGDFMSFVRCLFYCCQYGISWGHTQARQNALDQCVFGRVHTCITTGVHGRQIGKPDILANNSAFEITKRWFYIPGLSYGGSPVFNHCRGELMYRIGDGVSGYVAGPSPINFLGCEFGFGWEHDGVPSNVISNDGPVNFTGCLFSPTAPETPTYPLAVPFDVLDKYLTISGCSFQCGWDASLLSQKHAVNACGGVLCRYLGTNLQNSSWTGMTRWNLNTGSRYGEQAFKTEEDISNRVTCAHVYAKKLLSFGLGTQDTGVSRMVVANAFDKNQENVPLLIPALTFSISGRVLTVGNIVKAGPQYTFQINGGDVGDLVYDDETKTFFVIQSWDHSGTYGTWKLYALTNYTAAGNVRTLPTGTGYFWILNTRIYTPSYPVFGDLSSGSGVVSNFKVGTGGAVGSDTTHYTVQNDWVWMPQEVDPIWSSSLTKVYSISSGTITVQYAGAGDVTANRTLTYKRFGTFVRKAPTNDT